MSSEREHEAESSTRLEALQRALRSGCTLSFDPAAGLRGEFILRDPSGAIVERGGSLAEIAAVLPAPAGEPAPIAVSCVLWLARGTLRDFRDLRQPGERIATLARRLFKDEMARRRARVAWPPGEAHAAA